MFILIWFLPMHQNLLQEKLSLKTTIYKIRGGTYKGLSSKLRGSPFFSLLLPQITRKQQKKWKKLITHLKQQDKPNVSISGLICPIPSKMHKIFFLRTCNLAPNLSIFTYDTFLERIKLIDYHICQKIVIILRFRPLG